jgi:hypothetical protein
VTYLGKGLYDVQLPNAFAYSLEVLPDRYNAIVCGEDQDFCEEGPLDLLLSDYESAPLYVLSDFTKPFPHRSLIACLWVQNSLPWQDFQRILLFGTALMCFESFRNLGLYFYLFRRGGDVGGSCCTVGQPCRYSRQYLVAIMDWTSRKVLA